MATLTLVNEPTYNLELNAVEKEVLTAIIASTSGQGVARAFGKEYEELSQAQTRALGTIWNALDDSVQF